MSGGNPEAVRALFAAFAVRDSEAAAEVLDANVEIRPGIVGGPEGAVYRGPGGMRQFWADVDAAWAEFRIATEEFREFERGVLVTGRTFAVGRESGVELEQRAAWIAELREGTIVKFQSFSTEAEALKAAGLREER